MQSRSIMTPGTFLAALLASVAFAASAQTKAPAEPTSAKANVAVEAAFADVDANKDGKLSKEEAARLPAIGAKFDQLDKNKDGVLSVEEFGAAYTPAK